MNDLKAVFDSLYTNLLLRDLGAKVAPGMTILVAVRMAMTSVAQAMKDMNEAHLGAWLVAIAVAWLAGLAVQGLGEITGFLPFLPVRYFPKGKTWAEWNMLLKRFDAVAKEPERYRLERLIVVREATGNGCLAGFLATLVLLTTKGVPTVFLIAGVLATLGLGILHHVNLTRNWEYAETVAGAKSPA
jgi:hypothetical protein